MLFLKRSKMAEETKEKTLEERIVTSLGELKERVLEGTVEFTREDYRKEVYLTHSGFREIGQGKYDPPRYKIVYIMDENGDLQARVDVWRGLDHGYLDGDYIPMSKHDFLKHVLNPSYTETDEKGKTLVHKLDYSKSPEKILGDIEKVVGKKSPKRLLELEIGESLKNLSERRTGRGVDADFIGRPIEIHLKEKDSEPELSDKILREHRPDSSANAYAVLDEKRDSHDTYDSYFHDSSTHYSNEYLVQYFKV